MANCAKKGNPSGGHLDSIPPVIVKSFPENYSINFAENEIRIYFDEYIKLKDLQKNLIISPPMKYDPVITPLNTSKILKIKIIDTLLENTTYSFNFGRSIVDNNEENEFDYFKYVFSTGSYIDSLTVSGKVNDALLLSAENPVTVMLFEVNDIFSDSIVYSEKPMYITTTRDSSNTFEITNIKEGTYMLLALKEKNNDYTFQPKTDKVGFVKEHISLPTDSSFTVTMFKEVLDYKPTRPSQQNKNHIVFGYEGEGDALEIEPVSDLPEGFVSMVIKDVKKDTLHYWFKPEITADSLVFLAKNKGRIDTLEVRMKKLYTDSLRVSPYITGTIIPRDTMKLASSTPIVKIDPKRISIMDKDSVMLPLTTRIDPKYNLAEIIFDKTEEQRYKVRLLPGALTDFFEAQSDSLEYTIQTLALSDYGTLALTLTNLDDYPVIVQLVNDKFTIINEKYIAEEGPVYFDFIKPGDYFIRIVFDENSNGKWDTGNFLKKRQPEKVIYYPKKLEIRANWSLNETFVLD